MPHVVLKLAAGRSEETKHEIAQAITDAIMKSAGVTEETVSVAIEDVEPADWMARVYAPEIRSKWDALAKKPGY